MGENAQICILNNCFLTVFETVITIVISQKYILEYIRKEIFNIDNCFGNQQ